MSDDLKHVKVRFPELQEDGSIKYTTSSYYENLSHESVELEKHIKTSRPNLLSDLMGCLDSKMGIQLNIRFKHGEPVEIVKTWLVSKESFNRK